MTDTSIKTRAQSTQGLASIKAELAKTKLESRRSRTQDGTPVSYAAIKGSNISATKTRHRESRSFSDPDISGSLVILSEANGLFQKALTNSSFKSDPQPRNLQMPEERPLFITEKSKVNIKTLSSSLEEVSSIYSSSRQHMAEFANPLHRGNQQRFRKGAGVMASKPVVGPKPVIPPKPPLKSQPLNIQAGKNSGDTLSESPSKSLETECKRTVKNAREQFEAKILSSSSPSQAHLQNVVVKSSTQDNEAVCLETKPLSCSRKTSTNNTVNNGSVFTTSESDVLSTTPKTELVKRSVNENKEKSNVTEKNPQSKVSPSVLPVLSTSPASIQTGNNVNSNRKTTAKSIFYDDNNDDDDDGTYAKVVHAKPAAPLRPPPRKPPPVPPVKHNKNNPAAISDKEEVINKSQQKQSEIESEKCRGIPLYAQVDKSKKKSRSNPQTMSSNVGNTNRTSRSESDPLSCTVNATTGVQFDATQDTETIKLVAPGSEVDDVASESDSDLDDEGWDPMDFDEDVSSEFEDDGNSEENSQKEAMDFPDQRSKKLYNIAYEILTTERAYVKRLYLLDKIFFFRLQNECLANGHITADVLPDIFSNISSIYSFHNDFLLPKLEERMSQWRTDSRMGDILKTLAPFLKLYTAYIANFDKSSETLATWTKKAPKFAAVIEDIQKSKECENLTLGHHMLEPIQRVPRYKLLLKDYLAKLPEDSSDYKDTQDALEIISEAATHANDSMKKTERFKKLLELQERVIDDYDLITAGRQFIMEGDLTKVAARHATHQERTLLLFNDVLLCCGKLPGTNKLKVKVEMDLYGMEIGDTDEDVELNNTFRVTSKQRVIDFSAPTEEDRETWVNKINEAIQEISIKRESYKRGSQTTVLSNHELGKKAPAWVRDESVTMCMACDCLFTLTRRRHHCRACGGIYCNSCSHLKATLEYNGKVERVCQACHRVIVRGSKASFLKKKAEEKRHLDVRKISHASKVILSGYLSFKSNKGWVKRWCVLSDTFEFYCYKAKKDQKADFSLPLPGYLVDKPNLADNIDKKIAFKLHHKNVVVYYFATDSQEILERWRHNLSYAVKAERVPEEDTETAEVPVTQEI